MNDEVTSGTIRRFCVLQYIASEGERDRVGSTPIIIALGVSSREGEVAVRVHPEWEKIVLPTDRGYFEALFEDFRMRIRSDPDGLFRQLSDLAVGPLVTREAGSDLGANPAYLRLAESFRAI